MPRGLEIRFRGMMGPMQPRRILAIAAVVAAFGGGLAFGILTRDGGADTTSEGGIDWSDPSELPPPAFADYRSEFVDDERGYRFFPRSGRVLPSEAYRFDTGHCGLGFLIDFDGSFWSLADPPAGPDPLLANRDVGAIALVDFDRAVYRSSRGVEYPLERVSGPMVTQPCE